MKPSRGNRSGGRSTARLLALLLCGPLLLGAAVLLLPLHAPLELGRVPVSAAADSVLVVAGERYRAGALQRLVLGKHYRQLWTQPIMVQVLKLGEFAGGLRPTREGGSEQTRSLHFVSAGGRRFVFRSVDKEPTRLLPLSLSRSLLARVLQDQTSASHPASALIAAPLQAAAGLPSTHPLLVLLPYDNLLGPFHARFAGLLGILQESPGEDLSEPPDTVDADRVKDTGELLALLDAGSSNRVDERGFLTARLLDLFLNDWDRHPGQWRWLPLPESRGTLWQPIPLDRDQAFARYDGILLDVVRLRTPKLSEFGPTYPNLRGLTWNSSALDRRFLVGLSRPAWDSIAAFLSARLTDSVIADAVHRLPEPYWRLSGPMLVAALEQRGKQLRAIATRFYAQLAQRPEVHSVGAGETIHLRYGPDGSVELSLFRDDDAGAASPWFSRRFVPAETERIDLYFHRGRARMVLTGANPGSIVVRVFDPNGHAVALETPPR